MSGRLIISRHKTWHVWNRDNLEKVQKDEEEDKREKAKKTAQRLQYEREARYERMGKRKREEIIEEPEENTNINFFKDIEDAELRGNIEKKRKVMPNPEYEKEKKEEQERLDKRFTTYLGQSSIEKMKDKPWWAGGEVKQTSGLEKQRQDFSKSKSDPLVEMNKYLKQAGATKFAKAESKITKEESEKEHRKKEKRTKKKEKEDALEKLRQERIKREKEENERVSALLNPKPASQQRQYRASNTVRDVKLRDDY